MSTDPIAIPGVRSTRQRTAVSALLTTVEGFRTAQDLHELLREQGQSVGLTTVYRTLQTLVDAGEVDVVRSDDGESMYRRCVGSDHHHHLVCRSCGTTVEVEGPDVEKWAAHVAATNGFTDVSHVVEIFGTCSACAR